MSDFSLNNLSKNIYEANKKKGFYEDGEALLEVIQLNSPDLVPAFKQMQTGQRFALITSEVSEALESDRKNKTFKDSIEKTNINISEWKKVMLHPEVLTNEEFKEEFERRVKDTVEDEIADAIIRCLDFAGANNIDIDFHVQSKMRYNSLRPKKHGKKY